MAITLDRVEDLDGNTVHDFTSPWSAIIRGGSIRGNTAMRSTPTIQQSGGRGPAYGGRSLAERKVVVEYWVPVDASHESRLQDLEGDYSHYQEQLYLIVDEDGTEIRARCTLDKIAPSDKQSFNRRGHFLGLITVLDSVWESTALRTADSDTFDSGDSTLSVTNNGNVQSESAEYTLTATAQKAAADGQRWALYITPVWRNPWAMVGWPTDITDGGINHSTLISGSGSQADGDDIEVYENGRRVSRWLDGPNTTSLEVWINANLQPARYWTHRGSGTIASGATSLEVEESLDNLPALPFYAVLDGSTQEAVLVTAADKATRTLTIARSKRGTTAPATHAAGTLLYWVSTTYEILGGGTSLPAPDYIEDSREPMLDIPSSSNSSHVWADYQETGDADDTQRRLPRSASWRTFDWLDRGDDGLQFSGTVPRTEDWLSDTDPADAMVIEYRANGAFTGHPLQSGWELRTPVGIASVAFGYEITLQAPTTYPYSGSHRREGQLHVRSVDRDGNVTIEGSYEDNTGSGASGTDTITLAYAGYGAQFLYVPWQRADRGGTNPQEPDDGDGIKVASVTLTYDTDTLADWLVVTAGNEITIYQYGRPDAPATLTNALDQQEQLELRGIWTPLNTDLTVDVLNGRIVREADGLGMSHLRGGTYPSIPPGTTDLTWAETGVGSIDVSSSHRHTYN